MSAVLEGRPAQPESPAPRRRAARAPYLLVGPAALLIIATNLIPGLAAFYTSLRDMVFFHDRGFVGMDNYAELFGNPATWKAVGVSLQFTFAALVLGVLAALVTALVINRMGGTGRLIMTLFLIPWAMSPLVVAILWKWILAPFEGGLLVGILQFVGLGPVALLSDDLGAPAALVGVAVWRTFAFGAILLLAGLAQIPADLYRAASVDGHSAWEQFRRITLPLLKPSILIVVATLTISYFNEVQVIIGLTEGGPIKGTTTLSYLLYEIGFEESNQSYGNAIAVLMFVINMLLILAYVRILGMDRPKRRVGAGR
ncbi:sugar ABC transporter permease [Nonomuraea sp. NPDC046570]|uniref:carbohydrate ABC transporter permease n=1 Tax=Nonomuraea sp. NPDC046570 TaxID=3155255 RepID=UPI0033DD9C17